MKKYLPTLALSASLLASGPVLAAPVTSWNFDIFSNWVTVPGSQPQFTSGNGITYYDGDTISWGGTANGNYGFGGDHRDQDASARNSRSALEISDAEITGATVITNDTFASTNTITHFNNTILARYSTLTDASLRSSLTLRPNDGTGTTLQTDTLTFDIQFAEVLNQDPCPFPSETVCDDIFVLAGGNLNNSFVYDGFVYFVSIIETSNQLQPLHPDACLIARAQPGCLGFQTRENAFTPAQFGLLISSQPVVRIPEPGTMALLGMGLLGLGMVSRRRSHSY